MKRIFLSAILIATCAGCVNIAATRNPFIDVKVEEVYQSSRMAAGASIIVAFPQMMSDCPSDNAFDPINILTIPLGVLVLGDAVAEAAVDTVFLPFDIPMSIHRKNR